ncbi:MAG: DUF938 domain-containing protein [Pseudomonadota bacterium]
MNEQHFSQAAENNKDFILAALQKVLRPKNHVLEVASGTGQHADHFSAAMPDIFWQPSDRDLELYGLKQNLIDIARPNLIPPIVLDINRWPRLPHVFDAVYSANCVHVIDWQSLENYIHGSAGSLGTQGALILYGPFKYGGEFTTESNAQFDVFLRGAYPGGGIRDFEAINELAQANGLVFESDTAMPANNQLLIWRKS